ncbi:MAG: hypothetical protein GYB67_08330 [Chloroflexi bacterium]|nr:hypothetical protein [Chloroflexota bacterium]
MRDYEPNRPVSWVWLILGTLALITILALGLAAVIAFAINPVLEANFSAPATWLP